MEILILQWLGIAVLTVLIIAATIVGAGFVFSWVVDGIGWVFDHIIGDRHGRH